jgi:2-polyprenyl-3-methyl-5-hydroxy-6-metoxy-1,4-benzoquinol methylase
MTNRVPDLLNKIARQYPADMVAGQIRDIPRIAFNIATSLSSSPGLSAENCKAAEICDLGGGIGLFSVGCAALGVKRSVLIDDFNDPINHSVGDSVLDIHRGHGVQVISRDVLAEGIGDLDGTFDAITTFDSMEHWHHSPKKLFAQVVDKLKPGGIFVLGVPNCVNMRKRITVPLGYGKWSAMEHWYEEARFRGHVREPDIDDLKYICRDMRLVDVQIWGRNWLGYYSPKALIRAVTSVVDYPLRIWPQLCADIYVTGRKPC